VLFILKYTLKRNIVRTEKPDAAGAVTPADGEAKQEHDLEKGAPATDIDAEPSRSGTASMDGTVAHNNGHVAGEKEKEHDIEKGKE
jgi:hypothetical protein